MTASSDMYIPEGYALTPFLSESRKTQFSNVPELGDGIEPGKQYLAVFETNKGRIVARLHADETPVTVNSFVYLLRHHYYDGIVFHRVIQDFMAQTGDPTGTGRGGPGYKFDDEIVRDLRHDKKGILSMANAGKDFTGRGTNGSQIFITFVPTPHLDGKHTVFGEVIEGLDVLDRITRIQPGYPGTPDRIERAYVLEK